MKDEVQDRTKRKDKIIDAGHCRDCCCARSWRALGITDSKGASIPEHIEQLKAERDELKRDNEEWLRMSKRKDKIIDADIKEIAKLKAERDAAVGKPYTNIIQKEMLRDEFVRGLEVAAEIIAERRKTEGYVFAEHCGILDISDAIQAEIDKAKSS